MSGIRNAYKIAAALVIASNTVLQTSGLASPIAAGQTQKLKWWLPITVGATGGVKIQIVVPAAVTLFNATIRLNNTVAPASVIASQLASAAFANALANAGTHWLEVDAEIVNGVNAGTVDLQIAQNSSDALTLTLLRGATLEATII